MDKTSKIPISVTVDMEGGIPLNPKWLKNITI